MNINDNYLKECLKHVYWLNGGPCSGKTTMTKKLVDDFGFRTLSDDILKYRKYSDKNVHKAIQMPNTSLNWDEWFNRPTDVYKNWLLDVSREMLDYFLIDIIKMPNDKPIIIDLGIRADLILPFIDIERILGMFTAPSEIERLYFFREDHRMILDRINESTQNPSKTIKNANKAMVRFSEDIRKSCESNGVKIINRAPELSIDEQFKMVCEYFRF